MVGVVNLTRARAVKESGLESVIVAAAEGRGIMTGYPILILTMETHPLRMTNGEIQQSYAPV